MIKEKLENDLKNALKAGESRRVSVLRMVVSAIRNKEIEKQKKDTGLSDDESIAVLQTEVRKRRDSVAEFEKGGRPELAAQEKTEIEMIQPYLPAEATDEDIENAVRDAIGETGAASPADFGKAMKAAMAKLKGRADGFRVSAAIKKALGA
ncbi:MAG: GatB/YqeY domain-containing protein [Candidatus Niyogibacteria bacterium]|nr:GatB/YqeY domain-containing protein [Candidatus Niyogibacteria bacterium]